MFSNLWILLTALLRKIFMLELDGSIRFSLRVGSARENPGDPPAQLPQEAQDRRQLPPPPS